MKKLIYGGLILGAFATGLSSCQKETVELKSSETIPNSSPKESENMVYICDGITDEDSTILRKFENEDLAYQFLQSNSKFLLARQKVDYVRELRALAEKTGDIHLDNYDEFSDEMKDFLSKELPWSTSRGAGVLHDNADGSGAGYPLFGVPIPGFGNFRNKAESASGVGLANFIFDKKWFRGKSFYLLLGTGNLVDFSAVFGNKAESGI